MLHRKRDRMESTEIGIDNQNTRNAKIMAGLYGVAIFLFCFMGLAGLIFVALGSESDGVLAAKILSGPITFALTGFAASVLSMFFLKGKALLQILVPIFVSMVAGVLGIIFTFIFFGVIWRML